MLTTTRERVAAAVGKQLLASGCKTLANTALSSSGRARRRGSLSGVQLVRAAPQLLVGALDGPVESAWRPIK